MSTFDFEDGNGLVPARRHTWGGGWVADTAKVSDTAYVGENARVYGNARVFGRAEVYGNARVFGNALVRGNAKVHGNAYVAGYAVVTRDITVTGNACVYKPLTTITRSDGYTFIYVDCIDNIKRILAGCRYFSIEEARKHWTRTRGGTPLGDETLAMLDFFEKIG